MRNELVDNPAFIGGMIAIATAVVIVAGYVLVLRRKPQVDADLYSSIYGGEFEDDMPVEDGPEGEADTGPTAEQQALYGDDYTEEGGDYDYDYDEDYDGDYESTEEEPQQ